MTSMRSELGKIELNNIFQSRKDLNEKIREMLEESTQTWGISCDRYEILRIDPPAEVKKSMQLQAEAERTRRKDIILSEAKKLSDINRAEGIKATEILKAEAESQSVEIKARREKEGLLLISQSVTQGKSKGLRALDYILKRKYYDEYANILKNGNVTILPESGPEGGSSSDVLAAVAMMMNGGFNNRNQSPSNEENQTQKKTQSNKNEEKNKGLNEIQQSLSNKSEKGSVINWDAINFFNNPSLDKNQKN